MTGSMSRGMSAMREAKKKRETSRGTGRGNTFRLKLQDGDSVNFRFVGNFRPIISDEAIDELSVDDAKTMLALYGGMRQVIRTGERPKDGEKLPRETSKQALKRRMRETEPFVNTIHMIMLGPNNFRSFTCTEESREESFRSIVNAKGKKEPAKCVGHYCNGHRGKYKNVGYPKEEAGFSVWVETEQHKVEGKGKDDKNEYHTCTAADGKCKWCRLADEKGPVYPARPIGLRNYAANRTTASQIDTLSVKCAKRCVADGCGGKIKVVDFVCGRKACGDVLTDLDDVLPGMTVRCPTCKKRSVPKVEYSCSKCDNPTPGTLMDFPMEISRSGSGKNDTVYVVGIRDGEGAMPLPAAAMERGCVDWLTDCKPISTAEQAALCGLKSDPFSGSSTGSDSYDDDDDDVPLGVPDDDDA